MNDRATAGPVDPRRRRPGVRRLTVVAACLALACAPAGALTDEEIFRDFRLRFITPGARALGMGGAFVAVADDATAADANPAGLRFLSGPGVFAEFRVLDRDTSAVHSLAGDPAVDMDTGFTDLPYLEVDAASDPDTTEIPSFVSFAWPFEIGGGLTVAASRQVLASMERTLPSSGAVTGSRFAFEPFPNTVVDDEIQVYSLHAPVTGSIDSEIVHWNASFAYDLHEDFSLGVTLIYATLDMQADSLTRIVDPLQIFVDPAHPRLSGEPNADLYRTRIDDDDGEFTYTIGVHWHPDSVFPGRESPWRLGAVFRKGASFSVRQTVLFNEVEDATFDNDIEIPDRYAVGGSYRVQDRWTFAAQYERIEYSDLKQGFQSGVNFLTSTRVRDVSFLTDDETGVAFDVDDADIFRVGAEYGRPLGRAGRRLVLQAGYYHAPDDRIHMTQFNAADPAVNETYLAAFPDGEGEDHFTAGAGLAFGSVSFHLAGETSDSGEEFVGSVRFDLGRKQP